MNKLEQLKCEYSQLCIEWEKANDYLHSISLKIKEKNIEIESLEKAQAKNGIFKYKGATYRIRYMDLKGKPKSFLLANKSKSRYEIIIDSNLNSREKQKELHTILKRKKCLHFF